MATRGETPKGSSDRPFAERFARGLGWFSVGLGAAQVAAPGALASAIGVKNDRGSRWTMRPLGLRELGSGLGILTQQSPIGFLWGRVAGDVVDLALLGVAAKRKKVSGGRLAAATATVVGVTIVDTLTARRLRGVREAAPEEVRRTITIACSPEDAYRFWRNLENLPRFVAHLESIAVLDERRSHWIAKAPAGTSVEWDAEIIEDRPNDRIAWRSLPGADIESSGAVYFEPAPGGRGTEVSVEIRYQPPFGAAGKALAKLLGEEPGQQTDGDLRRLKQVLETGEVVRSDASIHATLHPARPALSRFRSDRPSTESPSGGTP